MDGALAAMRRVRGRGLRVCAGGLAAALAAGAAFAWPLPHAPAGVFAGSTDIGAARPGSTAFDVASDTYSITGGGADLWGTADAFRFAWKQLEGDAALTASVQFPAGTHPPNEKAVLMFRQSLDPGSRYVDVAIHTDGHITLQWRSVDGGLTDDLLAEQHAAASGPTTLRIERHGAVYEGYAAGPDGQMTKFASAVIAMHDPLYVGLGVCAHDAQGTATIAFSGVRLKRLPPQITVANP